MLYTEEIKRVMIEKLLQPNGIGITKLSKQSGIPRRTLFGWREKYCSDNGINDNIYKFRRSKDISASMKLQLLLEASELKDIELGIWLRSKGLRNEQLKLWKEELIEMANDKKKEEELKKANKRIKELEKELRRKEKALAEASALLILKKKAGSIWGDDEED